jgi:hypothetical protein
MTLCKKNTSQSLQVQIDFSRMEFDQVGQGSKGGSFIDFFNRKDHVFL